ncbi:MAG: SsrA-binding protein SmpB [Phycisphaerales bacterium]|nr:SsrA-binding protein SmpB [Phycisphaerales bacterium]
MAKGKSKPSSTPEINNRKARHEYHILETLECGIVLVGSEVKAVRAGQVSLNEGFARVDERTGEFFLYGVHISDYAPARGSVNRHAPAQVRKLLAHKREIRKLAAETRVKGTTMVPLKMYFKDGYAKVLIGLATGKGQSDKREDVKKRDAQRDMQRAMTRKRI